MLHHFEEILGSLFLVVMVTIAFLNVVTRYLFKYSMAFTEEITLYLFVWVVLLGTSIAFREGANMAVTVIYNRFPPNGRRVLYLLGALLSVAFFIVFGALGALEVMEEIEMGVTTEAVELPVWIFTISMPIAAFFTLIRIFMKTRADLCSKNY